MAFLILQLTIPIISAINRESNQLTSQLQPKHYENDHCDLYIEFTEPNLEPLVLHPEFDEINVDVQVKNENSEIFINESDFQQDIPQPDSIPESVKNESNINECNTMSDTGFTSDDSLPLELSRKKPKNRKIEKKETVKKVRKRSVKKDCSEPKIDRRRKPFLNEDLNETLFTITDLTFEEQVAEIEKRQESANYKNAVFKCTECFKGFLDEDAYNGHMSRHTDVSIQCYFQMMHILISVI